MPARDGYRGFDAAPWSCPYTNGSIVGGTCKHERGWTGMIPRDTGQIGALVLSTK